MPENLIEGLQVEIIRVKEIIEVYEDASMKGHGHIASAFMREDIIRAEQSIKDLDISNMVRCCDDLRKWEL